MSTLTRHLALPLLALAILAPALPSVADTYTVTDLGAIAGSDTSKPFALNDAGTISGTTTPIIRVVGHTVTSKGIDYHAFYWDSVTKVITDIGAFSGGQSGTARAVNSRGDVVGNAQTVTGGNARAFYWNPSLGAGHLVALSQTHDGLTSSSSNAVAINESGTIVGGAVGAVYWQKINGTYQCFGLAGGDGAFQINDNGDIVGQALNTTLNTYQIVVWKNLGTPSAPAYGEAVASGSVGNAGWAFINSSGQVAYQCSDAFSTFGFFWDIGVSLPQGVGSLGSKEVTSLYGLNDSGQVVGESFVTLNDRHAYLWSAGAIQDLGTLGGANSWGRGINNAGVVVGLSDTGGTTGQQGIRWDIAGGLKSLDVLTPTKGTFSRIGIARKISDRGNIVGEGILKKGGMTHAYLLTPNP